MFDKLRLLSVVAAVVLLIPPASLRAFVDLTPSLVAFWELEEVSGTRNDSFSTNHLTDNNTVTSAAAKVGTGAVFTAANSESLSISDNAALSMGVNQTFTISCWVNVTTSGGGIAADSSIVGKYDEFTLSEIAGNGGFRLRTWSSAGFPGANDVADSSEGVHVSGTWYMVTAGYDDVADELFMYRNAGTVHTTSSVTSGPYNGTNDFNIGQLGSGLRYFDGKVDQCGVWKRRLSDSDVAALYNDGSGMAYSALSGGGGGATLPKRLLLLGAGGLLNR